MNDDPLDREINELLDRNGAPSWLTVAEVDAVLEVMKDFEAQIDTLVGWGQPAGLFMLHASLTAEHDAIDGLLLTQVLVPKATWDMYDSPTGVLDYLAQRFESDEGAQAAVLTAARMDAAHGGVMLGFAFVAEAWVRRDDADVNVSANDDPSVRQDEVRSLYAVDVDERQYQVVRYRKAKTRHTGVMTTQEYERYMESNHPNVQWVRDNQAGGWPVIPRALRRMVNAVNAAPRKEMHERRRR